MYFLLYLMCGPLVNVLGFAAHVAERRARHLQHHEPEPFLYGMMVLVVLLLWPLVVALAALFITSATLGTLTVRALRWTERPRAMKEEADKPETGPYRGNA